MSKIVFVTATRATVSAFLLPYLNSLAKHHDVHVITDEDSPIEKLASNVTISAIPIARDPSPIDDLKSVYHLYRFFQQHKFDVVHSFTPKAGLVSQIAAKLAGIKCRLHTFTGQVWATKTGAAREVLRHLDKLMASLTTSVLVDSPSQKSFIVKNNVVQEEKAEVLGQGSISGVNLQRFQFDASKRTLLRQQHNISDDTFVYMFVGRLKKEKGVIELLQAFSNLSQENAVLCILGTDEENLLPAFSNVPNIHYIGFKTNVADYYSFADLLCLPSHREGFGNVIIEAAACGLPAVASDIYGLSDAVSHQQTGLLHEVKNIGELQTAMQFLYDNQDELQRLKENGISRVKEEFDETILVNAFNQYYQTLGITTC